MSQPPKSFRFTVRDVENLPPQDRSAGAREAEYSDLACPGLKVLVNRTGRKFWYYRYSFRKHRHIIKIGEFPSTSLAAARQRVNELRAKLDSGVDPLTEKRQVDAIPTLQAFAQEQYLPYAEQTKRSHRDDRSRLEHHIYEVLGKLTLDAITTQKVQLFLAERTKSGLAPATVNRLRSLLQRMFALAIQWDILEKNPVQGLPKLQENNARQRYLSPEEVHAFGMCQ
ncbi:integrase arm-type DNA-binding domain-containing protein [uncultured Thiodictyon sp.]|uniref:tyrosine-type recombinase/integrase n=1 Tax=uncultured Thiodictyon sp. TaxID=1846217 RepID=UPI0025E1D1B8|nr:integrase arm-type DNA-binding domain-containing protein [uncultured Thiodictyon sp.]